MKLIRKRFYICAGATAFGAFVCVSMFTKNGSIAQNTEIIRLLGIMITIFFASFSVIEYRRLQAARLILENQILYICPARLETGEQGEKSTDCFTESIEVYISCFGILLDSRIIRFNQKNIFLKSVEIGHDFIFLTYGNGKKMQKICILCGTITGEKIVDIVKKFHYETGIIPTIIN